MDVLLEKLAEHGVLGVLAVMLFLALRAKDRELTVERAARVEDAKAFAAAALGMQAKQFELVDRFEAAASKAIELRRSGGGSFR